VVTGVTVAPATVSRSRGQTQTFTATVQGTNNPSQAVTWTVTNQAGQPVPSTINASGVLTVSQVETNATLIVTATSVANPAVSGTATVTVTNPYVPVTGVVIRFVPNGGVGQVVEMTVEIGTVLTTYDFPFDPFSRQGHIQLGWRLNSPTGGFFPKGYVGVDFLVNAGATFYADWIQG